MTMAHLTICAPHKVSAIFTVLFDFHVPESGQVPGILPFRSHLGKKGPTAVLWDILFQCQFQISCSPGAAGVNQPSGERIGQCRHFHVDQEHRLGFQSFKTVYISEPYLPCFRLHRHGKRP